MSSKNVGQLGPIFLLIVLTSIQIDSACGRVYRITASYNQTANTPDQMGVGYNYGPDNSNSFIWLRYLNPNLARVFVQPFISSSSGSSNTANWQQFAGNGWSVQRSQSYGDQYGHAMTGWPVDSQAAWTLAINEIRQAGAQNADFNAWLIQQQYVDWPTLLRPLSTTGSGTSSAQTGNPTYWLTNLEAQNYNLMGLWDFRCRTVGYTTTDATTAAYWGERWETYRLMYIGGRWLAKMGLLNIEL